MYLKGWSAAVPTMKEDVGKMLAIMEAAHNKEQHALNGNIFPKAAPDSIKTVHALIDCNKTWPTIKQPDIPIQEQGREIQEVREIRTNIMLACDRTYTVPTRAGTFQQCIINVSALARNGMWEALVLGQEDQENAGGGGGEPQANQPPAGGGQDLNMLGGSDESTASSNSLQLRNRVV
ncbi:unnamed protein product [Macrosiphum euphorbiae]|uniref:Uncharacterized protein n=1 Tax=Macrosiphum euphorbiae TaxID=13131 RepID=A0AAV0WTE0_9HEMI|nr:unnamed protein product [Macrosiphum euphorbiae]